MDNSLTASDLNEASGESISSFSSDVMLKSRLTRIQAQSFAGSYTQGDITHSSKREPPREHNLLGDVNKNASVVNAVVYTNLGTYSAVEMQNLVGENYDLVHKNQLLAEVVKRYELVIYKLQTENYQLVYFAQTCEANARQLVLELYSEYGKSTQHLQQQITELQQQVSAYKHLPLVASESLDVQLARQKQQAALMDYQLQILYQELYYKRYLTVVEYKEQQSNVIYQINSDTIRLLQENQAKILYQSIEAHNLQQHQYYILLTKNYENIMAAYKHGELALQPAYQHPRVMPYYVVRQPVAQPMVYRMVQNTTYYPVYGYMAAQPNLLQASYVSQYRQHNAVPQTHNSQPTPPARSYSQVHHTTVAQASNERRDLSFSDVRAKDLALSQTANEKPTTPSRKAVKFLDSPPSNEFEYHPQAPIVIAPPKMQTNRLGNAASELSQPRVQSVPNGAKPLDENDDHYISMQKYEIAEEYLGTPLKATIAPAVQRSVEMRSFEEPLQNVGLHKKIPNIKEALRLYKLMQPNYQCKVYERQFGMGRFFGELFHVSAIDGLRRIRYDVDAYNSAIEALQERGHSVLMSYMHVLLRAHDILVRYVRYDDLEGLRKNERMPRPEGSGYAVCRLPLMVGKKWILPVLLY